MLNQPLRLLVAVPIIAVGMLLAAACSSSDNASHPNASAPPSAHSMSANATACRKLSATLAQAASTLGNLAMHPASAQPAVSAFTTRLKRDLGNASGPVTTAVDDFAAAVHRAAASLRASKLNTGAITTRLTRAANTITTACKSSA